MQSFHAYQKNIIKSFQSILSNHPKGKYDEQALPAYTNPNPLMRCNYSAHVKSH